ncbi:MAG: SUMF1/EgtB/PvdO family nonheme iron enzyme [Candidatus Paceibacterota bacterium]
MRTVVLTASIVLLSAVITSMSIFAGDYVTGERLSATVANSNNACPVNMVFVPTDSGGFCIDMFERSVGDACIYTNPANSIQTGQNLQIDTCESVVLKGRVTWVNVTRTQASRLCARSKLRLPSSREWFLASLGTPDTGTPYTENDCNLNRNWGIREVGATGSGEMCVSSFGAYDMTGNVWEWVDDDVVNGVLGNITLPESGYVDGVTSSGIPFTSSTSANELYGQDYFWSPREPVTAVMRGGFYGSGSDGGVFAVNAEAISSFSSVGIGFRCVQ